MQWNNLESQETESMIPKEFIPVQPEMPTAFQNPSYSAIANDEDLEEDAEDQRPEINYLEFPIHFIETIKQSMRLSLSVIKPCDRNSFQNVEEKSVHIHSLRIIIAYDM